MPAYKTFNMPRLLGLNEDENPSALAEGELTYSRNVYRRGRTKGTRPGFIRDPDIYTSALTGPIQGITQYYRSNGTAKDIVIVENGLIRETGAANLNGALTLDTTAVWTFAEFNDVLYGAGGASDDDFWSWDGAAASVTAVPILNLSAASVYPTYIFQKWNRLFAAGFRTAGGIATDLSSNPMTVRYSGLATPTAWPTGNTIGGSSTIGGLSAYGNEWITGFGEYTDGTGDWLIICTNQRLYAVSQTGDPLGPFRTSERGTIANGCVHQRAYVSLGLDSGDAIYLSRRGVHSVRSSQEFGARSETFLSWKIRRTFETINFSKIHLSHGAYDPTLGIVVFWVPTGSNAYPNLGLVLDVKDKDRITAENAEWDIWELGSTGNDKFVTASTLATNNSGKSLIQAGTAGGNVCHVSSSTHSDLTLPFPVRMTTKHSDYGETAYEKHLGDTWVTIQPGGNYNPRMRALFDYGTISSGSQQLHMDINAATWGSMVWGTSTWGGSEATIQDKVYFTGAGQTIAFDFQHAAAEEPFYIASIAPEVAILGEQPPGAGAGD